MLLLVTALTVARPGIASAQRTDGSIGVSLTIVPPVATQTVRVTAVHLDRDGIAVVRTMMPTAAHASQVVMTRVTSSVDGRGPARSVPAFRCATHATECAASELRYHVDVRRSGDGVAPRDVQLRIEYLVVAGT